jgi:hypothetical protein
MGDGGRGTDAGEVINHVTALKISTVFACVRVLSECVASLPVRLLRITPQGRVQEIADPPYRLLAVGGAGHGIGPHLPPRRSPKTGLSETLPSLAKMRLYGNYGIRFSSWPCSPAAWFDVVDIFRSLIGCSSFEIEETLSLSGLIELSESTRVGHEGMESRNT